MTTEEAPKVNYDSVYFTYTADTDPTEAVAKFTERYGHEPAEAFTDNGLLWCGPVSED